MGNCPGLTDGSSPNYLDHRINRVLLVYLGQGSRGKFLKLLGEMVISESATIDRQLARSFGQPNASHGGLAPTGS